MTIQEFEFLVALRKYKATNGDVVSFTHIHSDRQGGIVYTTYKNGVDDKANYDIRQENESIYIKILDDEYLVIIKERDLERIISFDFIKRGETTHSFSRIIE